MTIERRRNHEEQNAPDLADQVTEQQLTNCISSLLESSRELLAQKEMFRITLASIGDAVITTDRQGRITFLNPVAEELTGWSNATALGFAAMDVFKIVSEATRQPSADLITSCLESGEVRRLAGDTLLIRRDGSNISIDDTVAPILDVMHRVVGAVVVFRDVSQTRELVRQLIRQAAEDALTGLENRRSFNRYLKQALESTDANVPCALLYIDLDQFKVINDTAGHAAGDSVLGQVGSLLRSYLGIADRLARLGGDEFGIVLHNCTIEQALHTANLLREAVRNCAFQFEGRAFTLGASVGAVPIPLNGGSLSALLIAADQACYSAKEAGGNRVRVYLPQDTTMSLRHDQMEWVGRINAALRNEHLCLFAQPILTAGVNPDQGEWYEILVRMLDDEPNIVLAGDFAPAAERFGLITAVDRWVFQASVGFIATRASVPVTYSINISGQSLGDDEFLRFVLKEFARTKVDGSKICFEITETAAISNLPEAMHFMATLKDHGCRFALDDFGTGLSSFAYLRSLPVDYLKIAGHFVKNMVTDSVDHALVEGIQHIARVMGIKTVAEQIENEAILEKVKAVGVDFAQGNYLGLPRRLMFKTVGAH